MAHVAKASLGNGLRSVSDEEDAAICAFAAFLRRTSQGAYEVMSTRDDLWKLLAVITKTHALKQARFFRRTRRRPAINGLEGEIMLTRLASDSPAPELVASISETMTMLLDDLDEPELREVAMSRLEGLTNEEIAAKQNRSVRTIERRVTLIADIWKENVIAS